MRWSMRCRTRTPVLATSRHARSLFSNHVRRPRLSRRRSTAGTTPWATAARPSARRDRRFCSRSWGPLFAGVELRVGHRIRLLNRGVLVAFLLRRLLERDLGFWLGGFDGGHAGSPLLEAAVDAELGAGVEVAAAGLGDLDTADRGRLVPHRGADLADGAGGAGAFEVDAVELARP